MSKVLFLVLFSLLLNTASAQSFRVIDADSGEPVNGLVLQTQDTIGFRAKIDVDAIFSSLFGRSSSWLTDVIGSAWRTVAQPNSDLETGVVEDIFYVLKDTESNYYKLRFTRLVDPLTGERGNPQFQYELIQQ